MMLRLIMLLMQVTKIARLVRHDVLELLLFLMREMKSYSSIFINLMSDVGIHIL